MPRFAEFFAGIGLVREAIEPLGWQCAFANDVAPAKEEMYTARFGADHFVVDDINHLRIEDLPDHLDLFTASFPCIDLSLAGNRRGLAGKHSGAIWPFLDLTERVARVRGAPSALLFENVTGLLTSHSGRDLRDICVRAAALGFALDVVVVNARWFVPQSRPRLFVVAVREDLLDGVFPPTDEVSRLRPRIVRRFQQANRGLPFAELAIPEPPMVMDATVASVLEHLPDDHDSWWPRGQVEALLTAMGPLHRARAHELSEGERDGVATMFRRVRGGRTVGEIRPDRIAGCLRTPQGGSSVQFLVDCRKGDVRIRPLTGREYARLQGAEGFPIHVGDRQARLGFGDAVCVPAVRWLVHHALGFLADRYREPVDIQSRFAEQREAAYVAGG